MKATNSFQPDGRPRMGSAPAGATAALRIYGGLAGTNANDRDGPTAARYLPPNIILRASQPFTGGSA